MNPASWRVEVCAQEEGSTDRTLRVQEFGKVRVETNREGKDEKSTDSFRCLLQQIWAICFGTCVCANKQCLYRFFSTSWRISGEVS